MMGVFGRRGGPAACAAPTALSQGSQTRHEPAIDGAAEDPRSEARALAARLDASRSAMERRLLRLQREVSEKTGRAVRLRPLLLIPETCWRGRHGKFLLHGLGLNPYDPWNAALLPASAADAAVVEAPLHPGEPDHALIQAVNDLLAGIRRDYAEAYEQMDWTAERADVEAARERGIERVKGFAADRLTAMSEPERAADVSSA